MELLNTDGLVAEAGMADQGCHFNFFLEGQIFLYFSMPPGKIGKNSTLYVVI